MISSTRSSESASRSSWKFASSVISLSSIPSCSVRTSLTRSKTSSLDAAMSPRLYRVGLRSRPTLTASWEGLGTRHLVPPEDVPLALPGRVRHPPDVVVLDSAGSEPDGIRDRGAEGVAVRDHHGAAQPEQRGTAVCVGVEPLPETARGGPDQEPAELAARGRDDLLA